MLGLLKLRSTDFYLDRGHGPLSHYFFHQFNRFEIYGNLRKFLLNMISDKFLEFISFHTYFTFVQGQLQHRFTSSTIKKKDWIDRIRRWVHTDESGRYFYTALWKVNN